MIMNEVTKLVEVFGIPGVLGGAMMVFFYMYSNNERRRVDPMAQVAQELALHSVRLDVISSQLVECRADIKELFKHK